MRENRHIIILRIGLGITFVWIGYFIFQDLAGWAGFIKPWARELLIFPAETVMKFNAIYDIVVGLLLIVAFRKWMVWVGGILASLHMVVVLVTAGIDPVTVRDISVLASALSLTMWAWPKKDTIKKVE